MWGRFVVHALASDRPGNDAHRRLAAELADANFMKTRATGGKEGRLPARKTFECQRLVMLLSCIEEYFHQALH